MYQNNAKIIDEHLKVAEESMPNIRREIGSKNYGKACAHIDMAINTLTYLKKKMENWE